MRRRGGEASKQAALLENGDVFTREYMDVFYPLYGAVQGLYGFVHCLYVEPVARDTVRIWEEVDDGNEPLCLRRRKVAYQQVTVERLEDPPALAGRRRTLRGTQSRTPTTCCTQPG